MNLQHHRFEAVRPDEAPRAHHRGGVVVRTPRAFYRSTPLSRDEKAVFLDSLRVVLEHQAERPQTRADCVGGVRPCPWVSCKWHLYLDVSEAGNIKLNHPGREVHELTQSCALDVADAEGGMPAREAGALVGLTKSRVGQIERAFLRTCRSTLPHDED